MRGGPLLVLRGGVQYVRLRDGPVRAGAQHQTNDQADGIRVTDQLIDYLVHDRQPSPALALAAHSDHLFLCGSGDSEGPSMVIVDRSGVASAAIARGRDWPPAHGRSLA